MNSKRSSRKLWRLIDSFFLLLPLLIFIFHFVFILIYYFKSGSVLDVGSGLGSSFSIINDFFDNLLYGGFYYFDFIYILDSSSFFSDIVDRITDICSFFGFYHNDNTFWNFFNYYFAYAISYEFFSIIIQIIMWLPRWAKNKLYDWGDNQ